MKAYWVKTSVVVKKLFPRLVWDVPNTGKTVYLTFDDGPVPEVTPWVLEVLKEHNIKATFFCIGDNIHKHPQVLQQAIAEGHTIANHTFNHLNGWHNDTPKYLDNFAECEAIIAQHVTTPAKLFRPPYGRIRSAQSAPIRDKGYKIIMWDVLSADFDQTITPQQCLQNVINNVQPGSIIVFHDSIKASVNLKHALPQAIQWLKKEGYTFGVLS
ncbi:polysaccharide deacetylase [Flavobacterium akiainvivens]|uniref:Polysaccharide deacetylase n=1 Tax=Flavobacterium akiainvivens TaxID=1202724 RepID=A0A0M9VJD6_9FLAO|nr:polysaccharide deacetylase family protein [Flavobacterium akiainvivens]KOS07650.1 polysaccharide deacetylase [Flavobacterium akiainvivens]SFQ23535.1 Peptidoglycan/xylan/chitin deacetylase, PgdA/CDA1 family [Flavobacterium akiainvivens]